MTTTPITAALAPLVAATGELPNQWLLARASGIVAYVALTLAVVAGLTLRTRLLGKAVSPGVVTAAHRTISLVGLWSMALHVVLIALDTTVDIPLVAVVVPGLSGHRPLATGLGVVAMELWLLVHLSFRMRSRIGAKRWRALHMASFPLWVIAAAHGILSGSDTSLPWAQGLYSWSIALVAFLVVVRAGSSKAARAKRPAPARDSDAPAAA